jgi:hypothetical protein
VAVDLAPQHWTPLPDLVVTSDGAYKVAFSPEPYGSHLTGMSNAPFSTEFSERLGILVKPGGQRNLKEKPPSNYVTWVSPSTADRRHADSVPLKDACLKVKSMPAESDFSRRLGPSRPGVFTANSQTGPGGVVASWAPHTTPVYIGVIGPDQKLIEFVHPGDVEARVTGEARFVSPRPIGEFAVCVIPSEPADVRIRMFAN